MLYYCEYCRSIGKNLLEQQINAKELRISRNNLDYHYDCFYFYKKQILENEKRNNSLQFNRME